MFDITHPEVREAVRRALEEDIGTGDLTTNLTVPAGRQAVGMFYAQEPMMVAGVELLELIYELQGGGVAVQVRKPSGQRVWSGESLARAQGAARTLLTCERTALNFIQRLSAVATLGSRFVRAVEGTKCEVLDTRKTMPGLRRLEKMAAAAGGVKNHRMGLFDAILIKNNHIVAAGGVRAALEAVKGQTAAVEIEVRTLEELDEALECGATHLLLDNLTPEQAHEWIRRVKARATVEVSGGITLETVRAYAEAGADYVSAGAIMHSARSMDVNFRLRLE
jgi:nicotinate-nucleotide pyrophosphorylase (carboxylating)